jgi:hypothetical protein
VRRRVCRRAPKSARADVADRRHSERRQPHPGRRRSGGAVRLGFEQPACGNQAREFGVDERVSGRDLSPLCVPILIDTER